MAKKDAYGDNGTKYLGGSHMHQEKWRFAGPGRQIVDTSEYGPLSPAQDCEHCPEGSLDGGINDPSS